MSTDLIKATASNLEELQDKYFNMKFIPKFCIGEYWVIKNRVLYVTRIMPGDSDEPEHWPNELLKNSVMNGPYNDAKDGYVIVNIIQDSNDNAYSVMLNTKLMLKRTWKLEESDT